MAEVDGPTAGIGIDSKGSGGYAGECNAYNKSEADAGKTGATKDSMPSGDGPGVKGKDGW